MQALAIILGFTLLFFGIPNLKDLVNALYGINKSIDKKRFIFVFNNQNDYLESLTHYIKLFQKESLREVPDLFFKNYYLGKLIELLQLERHHFTNEQQKEEWVLKLAIQVVNKKMEDSSFN